MLLYFVRPSVGLLVGPLFILTSSQFIILFKGETCQLLRTLHILELTRSIMSKLAQFLGNFGQFSSVSSKLAQIRMKPAHSKECSPTLEHARSFLHANNSFWYASSLSLCHELSNDMLDYILFFRIRCYSGKNSSGEIAPNSFARA